MFDRLLIQSIPTENSALSYRKRQNWTFHHPNRELCIVISKKTRLNRCPSEQPNRELWLITSKKKIELLPTANWGFPHLHSLSDIKTLFHPNRELWPPKKEKQTVSQSNCSLDTRKDQPCLEQASQQRTLHCYIEKEDKNEPFLIKTLFHSNRELWLPKKEKRTVCQPNCSLGTTKD